MEELNVNGEFIEHRTIDGIHPEDITHALNILLDQIIKCLLWKSKKGIIIGKIILGNQRLNLKKLESVSGEKKFHMLSPEEVFEVIGYNIGGVPPIALINKFPLFIDFEVIKKRFIIGSTGTYYYGLKLNPMIFINFNVETLDIS